jgi:hypothetical protein
MEQARLLLGNAEFAVSAAALSRQCLAFAQEPQLLQSPYAVRTRASPAIFRAFLDAVEGGSIDREVRPDNVGAFIALCQEFGFAHLSAHLRKLRFIGALLAHAPGGASEERAPEPARGPASVSALVRVLASLERGADAHERRISSLEQGAQGEARRRTDAACRWQFGALLVLILAIAIGFFKRS